MQFHKFVTVLFLTLAGVPSLVASTTYTATYGPGPTVNYIETVGPVSTNALGNPVPPTVMDGSNPCSTLFSSGCSTGSFSDFFGAITVPTGEYVKSASLDLHYSFSVSETGLTLFSVTPVNSALPYTAGTAGSHFEDIGFTITTANGTFSQFAAPAPGGHFDVAGIDYTAAVQSSLVNGVITLAPIMVGNNLLYGFKTAQSAMGGQNAVTVFDDSFDLASGSLDAVLSITFATPEPSSAGILALGLALLAAVVFVRKNQRAH